MHMVKKVDGERSMTMQKKLPVKNSRPAYRVRYSYWQSCPFCPWKAFQLVDDVFMRQALVLMYIRGIMYTRARLNLRPVSQARAKQKK